GIEVESLGQFHIVRNIRRLGKEGVMVRPKFPLLIRALRRLCGGPGTRMYRQRKIPVDHTNLMRIQDPQLFENRHALLANRTFEVAKFYDRNRGGCWTDG